MSTACMRCEFSAEAGTSGEGVMRIENPCGFNMSPPHPLAGHVPLPHSFFVGWRLYSNAGPVLLCTATHANSESAYRTDAIASFP